jgi:hypothetical protein
VNREFAFIVVVVSAGYDAQLMEAERSFVIRRQPKSLSSQAEALQQQLAAWAI